MPDKEGNETPRERKKREREEFLAQAARDEADRKKREQEGSAWQAALDEQRQMNAADAEWEAAMADLIGDIPEEVIKNLEALPDSKEKREAESILREAERAAQGGFLTARNPKKAKRIIRRHRDNIKKLNAEGKKKRGSWGCAVMAVPLVGAVVAALYAAYEGASAVLAMF